jgi:hypothetical protein
MYPRSLATLLVMATAAIAAAPPRSADREENRPGPLALIDVVNQIEKGGFGTIRHAEAVTPGILYRLHLGDGTVVTIDRSGWMPDRKVLHQMLNAKTLLQSGFYGRAIALYEDVVANTSDDHLRIDALGGAAQCYGALGDVRNLRKHIERIEATVAKIPEPARPYWTEWIARAKDALHEAEVKRGIGDADDRAPREFGKTTPLPPKKK